MALIKASDALARRARAPEIRVPVLPAAAALLAGDPVRRELEQQIEALEETIAALTAENEALAVEGEAHAAELERLDLASRDAVSEAEARARSEGFEAGAEAKSEALAVLEDSAGQALEQLRGDLRSLETLAVALSKAALAKVFGEDRDGGLRVARLVRRQLEALDRGAVLRIEVSALDFTDLAELDSLCDTAGLQGIEVKAFDTLAKGDCRIRLRLGELDVGLGQQWGRLSALLDETLAGGTER